MTRPATGQDQAFLCDMLYAALYVPAGAAPFPRSIVHEEPTVSRYVKDFGSWPGDIGFIAEDSFGHAIGAAWLRRFPADAPGFGYVDAETPELSIAVAEPHRGNGVGTALLRELLKDQGSVSLSCDPENPACRLYKRFEFAPLTARTMLFTATERERSKRSTPSVPCRRS